MDSQNSSGPPAHVNNHHHHQPPPLPSHHHTLLMAGGPHQQNPPNNIPSYTLPNNPNNTATTTPSAAAAMNPRFPFNSVDHQYPNGSPSGSGGAAPGGGWFSTEPAKKKRGRPRKYSPDNTIGLGLSPAAAQPSPQISSPAAGGAHHVDSASAENPTTKRNRGRPPGSVKKQMDALGSRGVGFTPHVITVDSGEDIASKIMAFSQQGPRTVCILSAIGAVCNVTLRQPAMSGGSVTYEGRFEIISLSGSFLMSESNGSRSRTGGLSVSVAGPDGSVLGGGVAGILKAASPVQVVVGSFIAEGKKSKVGGPSSTPPSSNMLSFGAPSAQEGSPSSPGSSSESAEDNNDHRGLGPYSNAEPPVQNMQMYSNIGWPDPMKMRPN